MEEKLDLSSLDKALFQLEDAVALYKQTSDARLARHLRAACIQAFEFSYELCFKMLKRYLRITESSAAVVDKMTFDDLVRTGYAKGFMKSEIAVWREYRKERNTTSHTYDENKANEVFKDVVLFLEDAKFLLEQLKKANAS